MHTIISVLTDLISRLSGFVYIILALVALFESSPILGLFVPGVAIMLVAGFLASEGLLNLTALIIVSGVGAVIGDLIGFFIGRYLKKHIHQEHRFFKKEYLTKAIAFNNRWGKRGAFLGRFFGPLRATTSVASGISDISVWSFTLLAGLGSVIFFTFHILLGYFAGGAYQSIESWSGRAGTLLLVFIALVLALWWLKVFLVRQGRQLLIFSSNFFKTIYDIFIKSTFWKKFSTEWSRLASSIEKRFNPNIFSGLPMSALSVAAMISLVMSIIIGFAVKNPNNFLVDFDTRVRATILLFSNTHLAAFSFLVTILGSVAFITVAGVLVAFWFWLERRHSYLIALVVSVVGAFTTSTLLKSFFARPRPMPTFYFENNFSYPSAHATIILTFIFFLAYYAIKAYPRWSRNISVILISSVVVGLVGLSRLYLGVHYFSDVLGGYFLGSFWLLVGIIIQRQTEKLDTARRFKKSLQVLLLGAFLLILVLVFSKEALNKSNLRIFYYSPSAIERLTNIDLQKNNQWPAITENVRAAKERPVTAIIESSQNTLFAILKKNQWELRPQPNFSNIFQEFINFVTKKQLTEIPVRPRFWANQPNDFTFVRTVTRGKKKDDYIIRLWQSTTNQGQNIFILELSVNRDFSIPLPPSEQTVLNNATNELMKNLSSEPSYEQRGIINTTDDEAKAKIQIKILSL